MSPAHPPRISVALGPDFMSAPLIHPEIPPSTPCFTQHSHSPGCNLGLLSTLDARERLRKSLRRGGNGLAGHSTMTYYSIHGDFPIHTSSSPESRIHRVSQRFCAEKEVTMG